MNTQVVTVCSNTPTQSYYIYEQFLTSCHRQGFQPIILGWQAMWSGLMNKPRLLRQFLRNGQQRADYLIVCDAWDIIFVQPPDEISERRKSLPPGVIFNAERNCFPRGDLADQFPETGTPWRFLNSGFMMGSPAEILAIVDSMKIDDIPDDHQQADGTWFNPNDQEHYTLAYLRQPVPMVLDSRAELCMACHGSQLDELDLTGERIVNRITGTTPGVFHFNGDAKNNVMPAILAKLSL